MSTTSIVLLRPFPNMFETCPIVGSMTGSPSAPVGSIQPRQYNDGKKTKRITHHIFPGLGKTPCIPSASIFRPVTVPITRPRWYVGTATSSRRWGRC